MNTLLTLTLMERESFNFTRRQSADPNVIPTTSELLEWQLQSKINGPGAREFLGSLKWPVGLQNAFIKKLEGIPIRFFLCDDSASVMNIFAMSCQSFPFITFIGIADEGC